MQQSSQLNSKRNYAQRIQDSQQPKPNLTPLKVIGNGAFGKSCLGHQKYSHLCIGFVFEAYDNNNKCKVALKRTQKAGNIISREYEVLSKMKGKPNVVQLLDFFYSIDNKQRIIQNAVFEFCDKSLEDLLKEMEAKNEYMNINLLKKLIKQLLNGLIHMHEQKIIHRDLKPENILIKDGQVKICDLGSSKIIDDVTYMNTPYVVSRYYRAPELILGTNKYDEKIDIWGKFTYDSHDNSCWLYFI